MVNAVYHGSYQEREPIEVRITREDLVVLSYPGPDRSVRMEELRIGKAVSRRYRNRRIGEFLKELDLTEGRSTGGCAGQRWSCSGSARAASMPDRIQYSWRDMRGSVLRR